MADRACQRPRKRFVQGFSVCFQGLRQKLLDRGANEEQASLAAQGLCNRHLAALLLHRPSRSPDAPPAVPRSIEELLLPPGAAQWANQREPSDAEFFAPLRPRDVLALGSEALALAHEQVVLPCGLADATENTRRGAGAFYTPLPLARLLCRRALAEQIRARFPGREGLSLWLESPEQEREAVPSPPFPGIPRNWLSGLAICDPAVGGGAFLVAMLRELRGLSEILDLSLPPWELMATLHGVDLDAAALRCCKARLLLELAAMGCDDADLQKAARTMRERVRHGDSLLEERSPQRPDFSWSQGFADVLARGGFDVFVGNPPFLRIQRLPADTRATLRGLFHTARGKYDAAGLFVEQSLRHAAPEASLAFVLPSRLFTADHGRHLLRHVRASARTVWWRDMQDTPLFGKAAGYAALVCLSRRPGARDAAQCDASSNWRPPAHGRNKSRRYPPLKEVCERIFQGCISGGDRWFYLHDLGRSRPGPQGALRLAQRKDGGEPFWLEEKVTRPLLLGRDLRRFQPPRARLLALYPYAFPGQETGRSSLLHEVWLREHAPLAWEYLHSLREELEARGSESMRYPAWHAYWCPRRPWNFAQPKLLVQTLARRAAFTLDPGIPGNCKEKQGGFLFSGGGNAGIYGLHGVRALAGSGLAERDALHYLLALLNAPLLGEMVRRCSGVFRGGYVSFGKRYIADLPIAVPREEELRRLASLAEAALEAADRGDESALQEIEEETNHLVAALYS